MKFKQLKLFGVTYFAPTWWKLFKQIISRNRGNTIPEYKICNSNFVNATSVAIIAQPSFDEAGKESNERN